MKREREETCLLHAYLFESHPYQKDMDEVLHIGPLVKVWYDEDNGVALENPTSQAHNDILYPRGQNDRRNLTSYDFGSIERFPLMVSRSKASTSLKRT